MDSDSSELVLLTDDKLRTEQARHRKKKMSKKSENGEMEASTSQNGHCLELTPEESKYRETVSHDDILNNLPCTCCSKDLKTSIVEGLEVFSHPVLGVLVCKKCYAFYGDGNFPLDEDGSDEYCCWCGQGGTLNCCSSCTRAVCRACLKRNFNRSIFSQVKSSKWQCFVCQPKPIWKFRAICSAAQEYVVKNERKQKQPSGNSQGRKSRKRDRSSSKDQSIQPEMSHQNAVEEDSSVLDQSSNTRSPREKKRKIDGKGGVEFNSESEKQKETDQNNGQSSKLENISMKRRSRKSKSISESKVDKEHMDSRMHAGEEALEELKVDKLSDSKVHAGEAALEELKVDKRSARKACNWLQETFSDISKIGEIISSQSQTLCSTGVNLHSMASVKTVTKTVHSVERLVDLSVNNLTFLKETVKFSYDHWLKKLQEKETAQVYELSGVNGEQSEFVENGDKEVQGTVDKRKTKSFDARKEGGESDVSSSA